MCSVKSRALKCSVKSYVTGPSTKCYFDEFLYSFSVTHRRIFKDQSLATLNNEEAANEEALRKGWGEPTYTLVSWRQGFRHPARNECMG
jgi:hypothetical protein